MPLSSPSPAAYVLRWLGHVRSTAWAPVLDASASLRIA